MVCGNAQHVKNLLAIVIGKSLEDAYFALKEFLKYDQYVLVVEQKHAEVYACRQSASNAEVFLLL